jgi:DNA-binding NarL/FixJ family response regulator
LPEPTECLWDSEALWVARELAAGRVQIVIPLPGGVSGTAYVSMIDRLAKRYPMVYFVPEEPETYRAGQETWQLYVEGEQKWLPLPLANAAPHASSLLHEALDKYIEHIQKSNLEPTPDGPQMTAFGHLKVEQARRIKSRQPDRPLSTLDLQGCQELLDYWRMRPLTELTPKRPFRPMETRYCENHIAELNRFFRWLHKSKSFDWRKPEDIDELETRVKDLPDERTNIDFLNVEVFSLDELVILNKYATPLERLLLLLGLNCGFKGAEQGTLRFDHLFLDRPHPHADTIREKTGFNLQPDDRFVLYSRNKSKVYGEFLLWPQTLEGLLWAVSRHRRVCDRNKVESSQLLLTDQGIPFFRRTQSTKNRSQIFINKWAALIKRIRKDHPDFPRYSFTTLRDTAADLIRHIAGGEVAAVFLMHGKPVKKDDLLDLYTNRPFGEVFKALRQLEQDFKPVFDAAPTDAWETPMQQYTSLSIREQMLELHRQGVKAPEIARRFGKSPMTVYRLIERQQKRKELVQNNCSN